MAIFKYTVANTEGKKLSGTVEAPDETTARAELKNLGFNILFLEETKEQPKLDNNLKRYLFEAIDKNSKLISGTIPAKDEADGLKKLSEEYALTVTAIWEENASQEQIAEARKKGEKLLQTRVATNQQTNDSQDKSNQPQAETKIKTPEEEKQEQFINTKIEIILKQVNELLQKFDQDLKPDQKVEINKKIDKLLRIKHSTNLEYILATAEDLLKFIEAQEKSLKETMHQEQRFEFKVQTQKLLDELHTGKKEKSFSQDLLEKISFWQRKHTGEPEKTSLGTKIINSVFEKIKKMFTTPPEIVAIKDQIKAYNKQIWEFAKLYFKEPTAEYKDKVKNSIKAVWQSRKRAKENLKLVKHKLREKEEANRIEEHLFISFTQELNSFSGWLLAFYIMYYFASLYINTKDFGLTEIPKGFLIYNTHVFKYLLVIIFLLHAATAIKVNFFKENITANFVLPGIFVFGTIITLLNF